MSAQPSSNHAEPISPGQRKALFAWAQAKGLGIDDLRALTPAGSISAMSHDQASALLQRLNAGSGYEHPRQAPRGPRRPKGVYRLATPAQRRKIESLRIELGWTPQGFEGWLSERHFGDGRAMTQIASSIDAIEVIELLKAVLSRTVDRPGQRNSGQPAALHSIHEGSSN